MPGKQAGVGEGCWPDRLIGNMPNVYLYAANNPSEATLAKRRESWTPYERDVPHGFMRSYRKHVLPASQGAVLD